MPFFLEGGGFIFLGARWHIECDTARVEGGVNGSGELYRCQIGFFLFRER